MCCQNQNFGDSHGCLVGKYKSFCKKKLASQLEKKALNPSAQDLKMQWKINLFTLLNKGQNAKKKRNYNRYYIVLYEKNAFRLNFGPLEVPQPENA